MQMNRATILRTDQKEQMKMMIAKQEVEVLLSPLVLSLDKKYK